MRVRMCLQISGTRNGQDWPAAGEIADLPDDEAQPLVDIGVAVPVTDEPVESTAVDTSDAETATVTRTPRGRRGRVAAASKE